MTRTTRRSKQKVKTGCYTCKYVVIFLFCCRREAQRCDQLLMLKYRSRRVKCDEAKPACRRCVNFGRHCEGYPKAKGEGGSPHDNGRSSVPTLVPKDTTKRLDWSPTNQFSSVWISPSEPRFQTDQEYRYFQIFCEKTVPDLTGYDDPDLWGTIVPQACEWNEPIRTAAIALGALHQTLSTACSGSFDLMTLNAQASSHHGFALRYYGKAVRSMREDMESGNQDLRTWMISLLFMLSFELFHGNNTLALKQCSIALNVVIEQMNESSNVNSDKGTQEMFNSLDEALIRDFLRIDIATVAFLDQSILQAHETLKFEMTEKYRVIPKVFLSFSEARRFWDMSMRRIIDFQKVASTWGCYVENEDPPGNPQDIFAEGDMQIDQCLETYLETESLSDNLAANATLLQHIHKASESSFEILMQWSTAFEPLFEYSRTPEGAKEFIRATLLQLRFKTALVALLSLQGDDEMQYDNFGPLFQDIIDLCKLVIASFSSEKYYKATFTYDHGVIGPLYIVATKCRRRLMRRQAISMLLETPRREGIWDNIVAAKFASVIVQIEELGLEGGFVPESSRVHVEGISFDFVEKTGRLQYSRGQWDLSPQRFVEHIDLAW